jgi:putative redox protein
MLNAKMSWGGGLKFEGVSGFGLPIITDGDKKAGGEESGYKPTELILFGLAGCTGIDIVRILEKQRQQLTGLDIELNAYQPDQYPKPFNRIEIKFIFTGKGLNPKKVEKAIELSEEKYCSISLTLKGVAKIITNYEIREG